MTTEENHMNLRTNEAYEPGFGKYTLTEQHYKFGKINEKEASKFAAAARPASKAVSDHKAKSRRKKSIHDINPGTSDKSADASISNPEVRDENSSMHNNW